MKLIDSDLDREPNWEKKVGPDIGGPNPFIPPDDYGWDQKPDSMRFYTRGKAYTDWLAALHRPILPNTGKLTLAFDLMTDVNALLMAQAIEIDTRISIAGQDYNHSFQSNYALGGMLQVSNQIVIAPDGKASGGGWVDTGVRFGKFNPRQWYSIALHYAFDVAKLTYYSERIDIGEERFALNGPVLKAVKLGWSDGAHLQVQQDLANAGGAYSIYLRKMRYVWE